MGLARNIYKITVSQLLFDRSWRVYKPSDLDIQRDYRVFIQSGGTDDGDGGFIARHHFATNGCDVYVDGVWKGFIDFDAGEDTLTGVAIADGDHTVEVRVSKWFWTQTRTTKRYYITVSGGSIASKMSIPGVVNASYTVISGTVKVVWKSDWNDEFGSPSFTGFGIWTGATSPVSIAGLPSQTVEYNSGVEMYSYSFTPSSSVYVRIAGYYGADRGSDEEIYIEVPTVYPDSPENQFLEDV
jgi:hypothetical protein